MNKLLYKPVGVLFGVAASVVAGVVVKQVWRAITGDEDTPESTDADRTWTEVIAAAALQGLVFATIKAIMDRAGAAGVRRLTPDRG